MHGTKETQAERRTAARVPFCIITKLWVDGKPAPAYSKDISATGIRMRVRSSSPLTLGETYRLEMRLPTDSSPVKATARIARIIVEADLWDNWDIALEFVEIDPQNRERIEDFVRLIQEEWRGADLGECAVCW